MTIVLLSRVLAFSLLVATASLLPAGSAGAEGSIFTSPTAQEHFARSWVMIETAGGTRYRFEVELAVTPAQQRQGLMFRERLAANAGMLFVYNAPEPAAYWMKNTLIPLDMLFVAADGRIVNIHENAVPGSLDPIPSAAPVKGVLEIGGGVSRRLGIHPGDRVLHQTFGRDP